MCFVLCCVVPNCTETTNEKEPNVVRFGSDMAPSEEIGSRFDTHFQYSQPDGRSSVTGALSCFQRSLGVCHTTNAEVQILNASYLCWTDVACPIHQRLPSQRHAALDHRKMQYIPRPTQSRHMCQNRAHQLKLRETSCTSNQEHNHKKNKHTFVVHVGCCQKMLRICG